MTDESSKLANIHQHNAEYPREMFAVREVNRLLKTIKFPGQRIWMDVRFDYTLAEPTASSVDVMPISGEAHGQVALRIQGLFLTQDFKAMIEEALPHELAHIAHEIDARINNFKVQRPHDTAWQDFLLKMAPDATPGAKIQGDFDDRAIRLNRGGVGVICECGGDEAFSVIADSSANLAKLRNEELTCSTCKFPYTKTVEGFELPPRVKSAADFLESIKCTKLHHPHLQR